MNKKGFTLIELLGVMVILAALALITFPPLLNQIKNSSNKINDATRTIIVNSAQLYVNDNVEFFPTVNGNIYCLAFDNLIEKGHLKKELVQEADKIFEDNIVKINYTDKFSYDVVLKNECQKTTFCTVLTGDIDTAGSEVECGGEHFYVIEQDSENHDVDESTVTLLAKYNLNVGNKKYPNEQTYGLQDSNALGYAFHGMNQTDYGTVPFSENIYWQSDSYPEFIYNETSGIYKYINNYKEFLEKMGIKNIQLATLMSYEQANVNLYTNTSFWLGSANSADRIYAIHFSSQLHDIRYDESFVYGVRPVIIISKTSFEQ